MDTYNVKKYEEGIITFFSGDYPYIGVPYGHSLYEEGKNIIEEAFNLSSHYERTLTEELLRIDETNDVYWVIRIHSKLSKSSISILDIFLEERINHYLKK